jgi:transaldolase
LPYNMVRSMEILLKTTSLDEIVKASALVELAGAVLSDTQDIDAESGLAEIANFLQLPIIVPVDNGTGEYMRDETVRLLQISEFIVVGLPLTVEGMVLCKELATEGTKVCIQQCRSAGQAILAARAGASYVEFDAKICATELGEAIAMAYRLYPEITTRIVCANLSSAHQFKEAIVKGVDSIAITYDFLIQELS